MEKASGELSLTVITVIAIAALAGIIAFVAPMVKNWIGDTFTGATGEPASFNKIP